VSDMEDMVRETYYMEGPTVSDQSGAGMRPPMHCSLTPNEVLRPVAPSLRHGTHNVLVMLATFPWSTRVNYCFMTRPSYPIRTACGNQCLNSLTTKVHSFRYHCHVLHRLFRMYDRVAPVPYFESILYHRQPHLNHRQHLRRGLYHTYTTTPTLQLSIDIQN
jgi:hypothetical protein